MRLKCVQAVFFDEYGVICATKHLSTMAESVLKRLESKDQIEVKRTDSRGKLKQSRAWTEGKDLIIEIKRK